MSEAVRVRTATLDDAASICEIYAPYIESTSISFEEEVPDVAAMQQRMADRLSTYPWLVGEVESDGRTLMVGYIYAGQFAARAAYRWSVESSLYVDRSRTRRGIGRTLYASLLPILGKQGFRMVYAGIALPNEPSVGLHESLGFQKVANFTNAGRKFGTWTDVGWWALDLHPDFADAPQLNDPIPFTTPGLFPPDA